MDPWDEIAARIASAEGAPFGITENRSVGGGCINDARIVSGAGRRYFVKLNSAAHAEMFAAEYEGLEEIRRTGTVRVPAPVCHGIAANRAFIALEYLALGRGSAACAEHLGHALARMHRCTAPAYGWHRDNTIGSTRQPNGRLADWIGFWREHRLGFQLRLARDAGHRVNGGDRLLDSLPKLLAGHSPPASLLHGDLWGGNHACLEDGTPVVFDPAVYYGDREADIAMTELFGGFPPRFHQAYREAWPLADGYPVRRDLYNLYHVLNHLNLFGGGYGSQANALIGRLIAEAG